MKTEDLIAIRLWLSLDKHLNTDNHSIRDDLKTTFNMDIDTIEIDQAISRLFEEAYIIEDPKGYSLTEHGRTYAYKRNIEYCFSLGSIASLKSTSDQKYLETIFRDFGIIGMTDQQQRDYICSGTEKYSGKTGIDIGCGSGILTDYFQNVTQITFIGIDISDDNINNARQKYKPKFKQHDLDTLNTFGTNFNVALSIDSSYFSKSIDTFLYSVMNVLSPDGTFICSYSSVCVSNMNHENLLATKTPIGKAISTSTYKHEWVEFTKNEEQIWKNKFNTIQAFKIEYEKENCLYLYYDRIKEITKLNELFELGCVSRYIYKIMKNEV